MTFHKEPFAAGTPSNSSYFIQVKTELTARRAMVSARESQIMTPAMNRIKKIQKKEIATPEERSQERKG